ncbi:MAG: 50S ribosomal protein L24 [Deltaproteobacteria bacterium]|nr:50S ribosomal protein L24 [Deltaproteobacteria bacterium]
MRTTTRIRKEDQVMVMCGKSKGKTGKISSVQISRGKVIVEKLNMVKRHQKPNDKFRQGGIIEKEAPIDISNVMLICNKCKGPVRVGIKFLDDDKKVRYCKKCDEVLDK